MQQRIGHPRHAIYDITWGHLYRFRFRKPVFKVAVESELTQFHWRIDFEGNYYRRNKQIEAFVHVSAIVGEELNRKLVFWVIAGLDVVVQVHSLEVVVLARNDCGFIVGY